MINQMFVTKYVSTHSGEEKYQILSSSLRGVVSCKGAATSLVPRVSLSSSSPVSVYARLRLCQSPSTSVSVFARLRLRLPPSSSVSVVAPGGWSRGRRLSVRCSTSRVWKPLWRARSAECGTDELIVKRPFYVL